MQAMDAVVIGGGLSGLSAARRLKDRGAAVVVLEARSRVGGRVHSERLEDGTVIDLGAQFFADSQARVSALVNEAGLTRVARNTDGHDVFRGSAEARPMLSQHGRLPLSFPGKMDGLVMYWRHGRHIEAFRRGDDLLSLDATPASQYLRGMAFTDEACEFMSGFIEGEMCAPIDAFSAYELLEQSASVGGREGEAGSARWFLAEGMGSLAEHLADRLGTSIVLNAPVTRVEQAHDGVAVVAATGTYRASNLIVAVPPQFYASIGILPMLEENSRTTISGYRCGAVVKTVLVFERPWWRDDGLSGSMLLPDAICNAALDGSTQGNVGVLVLFSTARSGHLLGQTIDEAQRIRQVMACLRSLAEREIPQPIAARSIDWSADPWSRGGYASRRGLGGWAAAPQLFAPVGRIHFAGTETASTWRSFMEGALQSAERAADAVLSGERPAEASSSPSVRTLGHTKRPCAPTRSIS